MSLIDWPCGTTTIIASPPRGKRPPTEAEMVDHAIYCRRCSEYEA